MAAPLGSWLPLQLADLALVASSMTTGLGLGWWIARRSKDSSLDTERARAAIGRLRCLADSVAKEVDQHTSRVRQISTGLSSAPPGEGVGALVQGSVAEIVQANEHLQAQLASAETKLQQQAEEIENQAAVARTDPLTGLYNRRAFDDELSRRLAEWQRRRLVFSLLLLDIDHFKVVNDARGHQAGDQVLGEIGRLLSSTMREMDVVTRYGGEEFAMILPVTNLKEALRAAERARTAVRSAVFSCLGAHVQVTISIGAAQMLETDNADTLVRRADLALYAAKFAGRNRVHYHDGIICRPADEPIMIAIAPAASMAFAQAGASALRQAIAEKVGSAEGSPQLALPGRVK